MTKAFELSGGMAIEKFREVRRNTLADQAADFFGYKSGTGDLYHLTVGH